MNTDYSVGNLRIRFESRTRRRWFVAFFYAVLAGADLAGFSVSAKSTTIQMWITAGCMILYLVLFFVFSWVAGCRAWDDEREMHRRDYAHFRAYRFFAYVLMGAFLAYVGVGPLIAGYFKVPNPITPQLPHFLNVEAFLLYLSLPKAILLWTEPDMEQERT